jgi:hypothetical protein
MASSAALELHRKHLERRARLGAPPKQPKVFIPRLVEPAPVVPIEPPPPPAPEPVDEEALQRARLSRMRRIQAIIAIIERRCGLKAGDLKSESRKQKTVIPRQVAMFIIYHHTSLATPAVGRLFGGRDHSTVVYAKNKIMDLVEQGDEQVLSLIHEVCVYVGLPTYHYWGC